MRRTLLTGLILAASSTLALAQEVTLRLHHFMGERAVLHSQMLTNWTQEVAERSQGRMEVELFAAMSLGGAPSDLYDQAADGAVDIILTLPGYTAGRFNQSEVFELPFLTTDPLASARALWTLIDEDLQDTEFADTQVLSAFVHGPGVIHSQQPVASLEDMAGLEMRGPTRLVTDLIGQLGGTPVGMPLPAIPENLSKGVISATALPWEITPAIRLSELVDYATELDSEAALYTATFVMAMNLDAYDALPEDLRDILHATTGEAMAVAATQIELDADIVGRQIALNNGTQITVLEGAEVARWVEAAQPVYDRYIERAANEGFDGAALIARARALIEANR